MDQLIGKKIDGRFLVEKRLGEGAMGAVFLARDRLGTRVAVKVVLDVSDELQAPQRFLREVKTLNQLEHPNVVELVDFGRDEALGVSYLAMELIPGDDISRLVRWGRSSPALCLDLLESAGAALAEAHRIGIVHRDLKPANIMFSPRPDGSVTVKVLDFGLAWINADTRLTATGKAPGTVTYMSPEQLMGQPATGKSDVYALGLVAFELAVGRLPFRGRNDVELAMARLTQAPEPLQDAIPDGNPAIAGLIDGLLQKNPDDRPAAQDVVSLAGKVRALTGLKPFRVSHQGRADDVEACWQLLPK